MEIFSTEQEAFWAGDFGDSYTKRNQSEQIISSNLALFSKVLSRTHHVSSIIEFGANIGLNLKAIQQLIPKAELSAVEINKKAGEILQQDNIHTYIQSIFDFSSTQNYDFVLIKGVLIHINPERLSQAYKTLYEASKRYICIVEYYNATPVEITYRGHKNKLFKRDFAGELLDQFDDLTLLDYGFVYHRDPLFPQDDVTWFLLEKSPS
ncbi:MAG: pseudaminic acid biosynthesis-associated methylase [Cyanobacteria bacterium P01_B01_bin.77]